MAAEILVWKVDGEQSIPISSARIEGAEVPNGIMLGGQQDDDGNGLIVSVGIEVVRVALGKIEHPEDVPMISEQELPVKDVSIAKDIKTIKVGDEPYKLKWLEESGGSFIGLTIRNTGEPAPDYSQN